MGMSDDDMTTLGPINENPIVLCHTNLVKMDIGPRTNEIKPI